MGKLFQSNFCKFDKMQRFNGELFSFDFMIVMNVNLRCDDHKKISHVVNHIIIIILLACKVGSLLAYTK